MRELNVPYEVVPDPDSTKSKILLEAARLFAVRGYAAVSIRDITTAVGITPGTVYAHFTSKQEILDTIMDRCGRELHEFYRLLDSLSARAETFDQLLDNIFLEARETTNPFSFYAIWCAMTTQFEFESARHLYYDIYFQDGHEAMRRQLQIAIDRGLAPPFDVAEMASLITNCFLMLVGFHVGQLAGHYSDFDIPEWYNRQIAHLLRVADAAGVPQRAGE